MPAAAAARLERDGEIFVRSFAFPVKMKIFGHFLGLFPAMLDPDMTFYFTQFGLSHILFYIYCNNKYGHTFFSLSDDEGDTAAVISGGPHTYAPPIKSSSSAGSVRLLDFVLS